MMAKRNIKEFNGIGMVPGPMRHDGTGGTCGMIPGIISCSGNAGYGAIQKPIRYLTKDEATEKLERSLDLLQKESFNFAYRFIHDPPLRLQYIRQSRFVSRTIMEEFKGGRLTAHEAARYAQSIRNEIMDAMRIKSTDLGRAWAEEEKLSGTTLQELEVKYAQKKYSKPFTKLTETERNPVWLEIVKSSGRPQPEINKVVTRYAKAGKALVFLSVAVSVYNVATAENKGRQVIKEGTTTGVGILGGMAGGAIAGLACGPGAPVCVAVGVFVGGAIAAVGSDFAFDWAWK